MYQVSHPSRRTPRPLLIGLTWSKPMGAGQVGRLYLCARLACRTQVLVCRDCDHGQIYCCRGCSAMARAATLKEAGRRYQNGRQGRQQHAQRMARYRERKRKVTHHRSRAPLCDVLLISVPTISSTALATVSLQPAMAWHCRFCGCPCSKFVRTGYLDGRVVRNHSGRGGGARRRGDDHGHGP